MKSRGVVVLAVLLFLTVWYGLSFIGVPGLVSPWNSSYGIWLYVALALAVGLIVGTYALWRGWDWSEWQLLSVLGAWVYVQYVAHWRRFFTPPSPEIVQRYYEAFPTWYLIPRQSDRVVPDGYHVIMHLLMIILVVMLVLRVIRRLSSAAPNKPQQQTDRR